MLTGLLVFKTLCPKKSTQAPFANSMNKGSQTQKGRLTSSAKAGLAFANETTMTARKQLRREGHNFSKQSELVIWKLGTKTQE